MTEWNSQFPLQAIGAIFHVRTYATLHASRMRKKKNHYQTRLQGASEIESTLRHFRTACTDEALNQYYDSSTSLHKITTNHTASVARCLPMLQVPATPFWVGGARNLRRNTLHRTGTVPYHIHIHGYFIIDIEPDGISNSRKSLTHQLRQGLVRMLL